MNPERIYLEHLEAIEFVSFAARRRRLDAGAASEEPEEARLSLLAGDHAVISQFERHRSFLTDPNRKTDVPGPSNRTDGNVVRDGKEMLR